MRFVVAGGGVAGLATALAVARAGHEVVVLERDPIEPGGRPLAALEFDRRGIPHYLQPHAFLPRGRKELSTWAPDVLEMLIEAGAESQDLAEKLHGQRIPGDEDLVYLWARRPLIEWALRTAAGAEPSIELRHGVRVTGLDRSENGPLDGLGVQLSGGDTVRADIVVDALGRYRCPPGWPRTAAEPVETGAIYYCRYFQLAPGADHTEAPLLNPRGDLGYMGFNTFRGDNRTFAIILLVPAADRDLRVLRDPQAWATACASITPLDTMTAPDHARPITDVMPMAGLMNVDRTHELGAPRMVAVGDAFCHTDPAFAWGLSFCLAHARSLAEAAAEAPDAEAVAERYRVASQPEAQERYALSCAIDADRARRWQGDAIDIRRRDDSPALFSFYGALAAAPHDDEVLRRAIRRIGLLDRVSDFDEDPALHQRIESILGQRAPAPPPGPPRAELLARLGVAAAG